jgi:hypothetical protein
MSTYENDLHSFTLSSFGEGGGDRPTIHEFPVEGEKEQ